MRILTLIVVASLTVLAMPGASSANSKKNSSPTANVTGHTFGSGTFQHCGVHGHMNCFPPPVVLKCGLSADCKPKPAQ